MRALRLAPEAIGDLSSIRRYTTKQWGRRQADTYLRGIGRRFRELAAGNATIVAVDDLRTGYKRARYRSHFIFFRLEPDSLDVIRILHVKMDLSAHLLADD